MDRDAGFDSDSEVVWNVCSDLTVTPSDVFNPEKQPVRVILPSGAFNVQRHAPIPPLKDTTSTSGNVNVAVQNLQLDTPALTPQKSKSVPLNT